MKTERIGGVRAPHKPTNFSFICLRDSRSNFLSCLLACCMQMAGLFSSVGSSSSSMTNCHVHHMTSKLLSSANVLRGSVRCCQAAVGCVSEYGWN